MCQTHKLNLDLAASSDEVGYWNQLKLSCQACHKTVTANAKKVRMARLRTIVWFGFQVILHFGEHLIKWSSIDPLNASHWSFKLYMWSMAATSMLMLFDIIRCVLGSGKSVFGSSRASRQDCLIQDRGSSVLSAGSVMRLFLSGNGVNSKCRLEESVDYMILLL